MVTVRRTSLPGRAQLTAASVSANRGVEQNTAAADNDENENDDDGDGTCMMIMLMSPEMDMAKASRQESLMGI